MSCFVGEGKMASLHLARFFAELQVKLMEDRVAEEPY
jgi:hypothetical protein